jgi:hypothetical protein
MWLRRTFFDDASEVRHFFDLLPAWYVATLHDGGYLLP